MKKKKESFSWIQSNFSSRQSFRKFPLLASLHRITDGALIGIVFAVGIMSTVALHTQYLWTVSFSRLEITRDLNRRLLESTAILETDFLQSSNLSKEMDPTKPRNLIYIDAPPEVEHRSQLSLDIKDVKRLMSFPANLGY